MGQRNLFDSPLVFGCCLALLTAAFLATAWARASPTDFGRMHDDSLYFSSAKALAEGRGFVMPSVPGEPDQTKYPILYPLLLAGVWRFAPDYPANIGPALLLNLLFAAGLILGAVAVVRQLGASRAESLLLATVFAFQPFTLYWSGQLMSDALFGACGLLGAAAAYRAIGKGGQVSALWLAAALVALWAGSLTRSLGAAFALGAALFLWRKGARWASAGAMTACLPLAFSVLRGLGGGSPDGFNGFEQTLVYYTSYGGFWKISVPDWETFQAQLTRVGLLTFQYPAVLSFFPLKLGTSSALWQSIGVAVSVGVLNGVRGRLRQRGEMHPIHWAALAYLPLTLPWNYALVSRFWLPFAPLLIAGAAFELRRVGGTVGRTLRGPAPTADRVVSAGFAGAMAAMIGYAAWGYAVGVPRAFESQTASRAKTLENRRAAYRHLAAIASPDARVISYEDVSLYLATGLRGMRPMAFSTAAYYLQSEAILDHDLDRLGDVADAIDASYWVTAEDDFELETGADRIRDAVADHLAPYPVIFEQAGVRIHQLQPAAAAGLQSDLRPRKDDPASSSEALTPQAK